MRDKLILGMRAFFAGKLYPISLGAVVLLSHIFGLEAIGAPIIVLAFILTLFIFDSAEYTLAPIVLFTYLLSREHTPSVPSYSDYLTSPLPLTVIILMAVALAVSIVCFFLRGKKYKQIKLRYNPIFSALVVFCLLLFVSAFASGENVWKNIAFAAVESVALIIPFLLFCFGIPKERCVGELAEGLPFAALVSSTVIVIELFVLFITTDVFSGGSLNKEAITLGWGIWNSIGGMLTLSIPLLFLGAIKTRHTALYYGAALVSYLASVLTLSRNSLVVGTLIFGICSIACAIFGKKKRTFRRILLVLVCIFAVFALVFSSKIAEILSDYIDRGFSDNGRFELWRASFAAFLENPILGIGFHNYGGEYYQFAAFMPRLPHNTLLALLGGGGILLTLAYLAYRATTVALFVRKPSLEKTLLGLCVLTLILGSLLDNYIFNFYPTFMYTAAISIARRLD